MDISSRTATAAAAKLALSTPLPLFDENIATPPLNPRIDVQLVVPRTRKGPSALLPPGLQKSRAANREKKDGHRQRRWGHKRENRRRPVHVDIDNLGQQKSQKTNRYRG